MAAETDKDMLIKQFGELLNALTPNIESNATREGLTVTLRFAAQSLDKPTMRKLSVLLADNVA